LRAALADLVKAGEEARVTESLVDEVIQRIEAGRAARRARLEARLRP